jgi:RNA polymerase sigma-70 factor, ECF subfamily
VSHAGRPAVFVSTWRGYTADTVEVGITLGAHGQAATTRESSLRALDDAGVLAALVGGDARVLEIVYERHSRGVYSLALRLLADGQAAEEVVQETFLKLWRQPLSYQPSRGRLLAWLLGVAHHHAVDMLRRRQLEQRHSAGSGHDSDGLNGLVERLGIASPEEDPQSRVGALDHRAVVERALASLPPEQRVPLELAYYRGMTQVQIAASLGHPLGTIKTRMRLALQQLRQMPGMSELWSER